MNPGIEAVRKLAHIGYRLHLEGESIRLRYEGQGTPDAGQVAPLLDLVRQNIGAVRFFLRCYCPRCGGVFFGTFNGVSRCMACYWEEQARLYPDMVQMRH
jgi:hypothetical protein